MTGNPLELMNQAFIMKLKLFSKEGGKKCTNASAGKNYSSQ